MLTPTPVGVQISENVPVPENIRVAEHLRVPSRPEKMIYPHTPNFYVFKGIR